MKDLTARARVLSYLEAHGRIEQSEGRATAALKDAIGYQGSQLGFTQLIAAMSKAGEIYREVRGKRTYAISLRTTAETGAAVHQRRPSTPSPSVLTAATHVGGPGWEGSAVRRVDPDELAEALLARAIHAALGDDPRWGISDIVSRLDSIEGHLKELGAQVEALRSHAAPSSSRHAGERLGGAELMYLQDLARGREPVVRDEAN